VQTGTDRAVRGCDLQYTAHNFQSYFETAVSRGNVRIHRIVT